MKLLYFLTNYPYYSETFVAEEIRQLQAAGHIVTVCNFTWYKKEQDGKKEQIYNNSKNPLVLLKASIMALAANDSYITDFKLWRFVLSCIKLKPHFTLKYIYLFISLDYMLRQLKDLDFDLAISHFLFKSTLGGFFICKKLEKKYHIRLHTKRSLYTPMVLHEVLSNASNITAESQDVGRFFENVLGVTNTIKTVRQSIDFLKLSELSPKTDVSKTMQVIAIGRLVEKKGFEVLINAIALNRSLFEGEMTCEIYGDGPLEDKLRKLIKATSTSKIIKLYGRAEHAELMTKLAKADLLVVPSIELENDIDGVPTVIAEAMSVKTTVLASDIGGIAELIQDNKTGFLVQPNNIQELANALVLLQDLEIRRKVIASASIKVEKEYKHTLAKELGI